MSQLAEAIADAIMLRLALHVEPLDPDQWDERRAELLEIIEAILTAEERNKNHA